MNTLILSNPACMKHEPGPGHPEKPERMEKVLAALHRYEIRQSPIAEPDQITRAHDARYVARVISSAPRSGLFSLDEDTKMSPGSLEAALAAAGAACYGVDMVMSGKAQRVFCATRPPGHHAFYDKSMGFCIFNNVAVAAAHAQARHKLKRVAIVDFDVHHGNGTQDIVERQLKDACFVSLQEKKLWPYNDEAQTTADNILNVGIPRGAAAADWHTAFDKTITPFLRSYNPELIIISAGFDAHRDDPPADILFNDAPAQQNLTDDDYVRMTRALCAVADECCEGRIVSCMEGGYNTDVLAKAAAAHVGALAESQKAAASRRAAG